MRRIILALAVIAALATAASALASPVDDFRYPAKVNAGRVTLGESSQFTIKVTNTSKTTSHTIVGWIAAIPAPPEPPVWQFVGTTCTLGTSGYDVAPGTSCVWTYRYTPQFRGQDTAQLTFMVDAASADNYFTVLASGFALLPKK
jgi:hypothetical protein